MIRYHYHDGGRRAAGFKGTTGDCVVRAIAIVTRKPYREVYDELHALMNKNVRGSSPRTGVPRKIIKKYLTSLGYQWFPCMGIGTGCQVHLDENELPPGRLIVSLSGHIAAVVNGELFDTHDCSREGHRCVYGYWT